MPSGSARRHQGGWVLGDERFKRSAGMAETSLTCACNCARG